MEKVRTRDFIYTVDDLYFASTNYIHPEDRFISFLRYIPDPDGDREKDGKRYSKVNSEEAYSYLKNNYPEYLYFCENTQIEMMGVPLNKVKKIIKPEKRLEELKNTPNSEKTEIIKKLIDIADFFHYIANIPYENLGISGSILPNLQKKDVSDIDFVVYGLSNHRKAINTFKKYKDEKIDVNGREITLNKLEGEFFQKVYDKRMKDSSLSKEEFNWYENRKSNRGLIKGTLFDILATKDYDEIHGKWGDTKYEKIGISKIEARIKNALNAFDNPATYEIKDLKVIEGLDVNITEIASFTHTYAGEVIEEEEVIAKGKIEVVKKEGCSDKFRLVVGTTRESIDEYVKLKEFPPV